LVFVLFYWERREGEKIVWTRFVFSLRNEDGDYHRYPFVKKLLLDSRSSMSLASWGCGVNPHIILFQVPVSDFWHMRIQYVENVRFRVFFSSGCFQYISETASAEPDDHDNELMACRWS
jgi:hypothetical protein